MKMGEVLTSDYINSYDNIEVHRLMLEDHSRTEAFQQAINSMKEYIEGKVVMDVGAGTGVLSIFCAKAGAKKVYAVEGSNIAEITKEVILDNQLSSTIEVISSLVENVVLPNDEKVDVIVSEWMGFYLLHEGMLDSVITAREKFLKPGGKIFPEFAEIWAAPCSLPSLFDFWENIYGINMSAIGREERVLKSSRPEIMAVEEKYLLSEPELIFSLDLNEVKLSDVEKINHKCVCTMKYAGKFQGICLWFTCSFPSPADVEAVVLSTHPKDPTTHWKQTVIVLPEQKVEEGEPIAWAIKLTKNPLYPRQYDMEFTGLDSEEETHPIPCQCYRSKCLVIRAFLEKCDYSDDEDVEDTGSTS